MNSIAQEIIASVYPSCGKNYGPLSPAKWIYHTEPTRKLIDGNDAAITPVTVHLALTLRCDHSCYFCTYGGAIGNSTGDRDGAAVGKHSELRLSKKDMDFQLMIRTLAELAEVGIKGVIFTGGGEPTLYPYLADAMEACSALGMNWSMNTNGRHMTDSFLNRVMPLNPIYIRVSLNSGSPAVQEIVSGVDDYELIVENIEQALIAKHKYGVMTDISVGYVVNLINVFDMPGIVREMIKIEERLASRNIPGSVFSIQFRPVGNYESSKKYSPLRIKKIRDYLKNTQGEEAVDEFTRFMFEGEQCSIGVLQKALQTLEGEITDLLKKHNSKICLIYPKQKYIDIPQSRKKEYSECKVLPWFLFIWPDGTLYPCIEWAGTPGFDIGNLAKESIRNFLFGGVRAMKIEQINREVVHTRCASVCAHHEMNIGMDRLCSKVCIYGREEVHQAVNHVCANALDPLHKIFL